MVGEGGLLECLENDSVERVLAVSRKWASCSLDQARSFSSIASIRFARVSGFFASVIARTCSF